MSVNSAFLRLVTSAEIASDLPGAPGTVRIGRDVGGVVSAPKSAYAFRLFIPATDTSATINTTNGELEVSAGGTRQVETITITAAGGATANGNLALTLTCSLVAGSPLAIQVPLRTQLHTTAAKIAAAIAAKLNATPAVAAVFKATSAGAGVYLTSIYALANESAWNLAVTAGLGVSAVTSSTTDVSGVKGIIIERLGGDGKDALGQLITGATLEGIAIVNASSSTGNVTTTVDTTEVFPRVGPGGWTAALLPPSLVTESLIFSTTAKSIVDVYIHAS